jgi:hypothetical protein
MAVSEEMLAFSSYMDAESRAVSYGGSESFQKGMSLLGLGGAGFMFPNENPRYQSDTHGIPEQLLGKNEFLRETIDCSVERCEDFVTRLLLPVVRQKNPKIQWSVLRMDQHLVGPVPAEGLSQLYTASKDIQGAVSNRRGLAMRIERDFALTPDGHSTVMMSLRGLMRGISSTVSLDGLVALMSLPTGIASTAGMQYADYDACVEYAQAQKQFDAMRLVVGRATSHMARTGLRPTVIVIPPGAMTYLLLTQNDAGWEQSDSGKLRLRGCEIFESPVYPGLDGQDSSPLWRISEVGEMYYIPAEPANTISIYNEKKDTMENCPVSVTNTTSWQDDIALDKLKIWANAKWNTVRDDYDVSDTMYAFPDPMLYQKADGTYHLSELTDKAGNRMHPDYVTLPVSVRSQINEATAEDSAFAGTETEHKWILRATRVHKKTFANNSAVETSTAVDNSYSAVWHAVSRSSSGAGLGLILRLSRQIYKILEDGTSELKDELQVVCMRPFIAHKMGSVLCVQGGGAAGNTYIGDNSFDLQEDNTSDCYYGNATFYSKSVITNFAARHVTDSVFAGEYLGGCELNKISVREDGLHGDWIAAVVPRASSKVSVGNMIEPEATDMSGWLIGPQMFVRLGGCFNICSCPMYQSLLVRVKPEDTMYSFKEYTAAVDSAWASGSRKAGRNSRLFNGDFDVDSKQCQGIGHWSGMSRPGRRAERSGRVAQVMERQRKVQRVTQQYGI